MKGLVILSFTQSMTWDLDEDRDDKEKLYPMIAQLLLSLLASARCLFNVDSFAEFHYPSRFIHPYPNWTPTGLMATYVKAHNYKSTWTASI